MPVIRVIETDGARLHTERRGDGPPLLLISGGDGRAANFDAVAGMLAWDFTVLTYDRRGHARSRLTPDADGKPDASGQISMAQQSADARAVIGHHGFAAAAVLGASAGALIGLDLAASSPDVVQVLVAHEPPLISVLPEAARLRADRDDAHRILERDGPRMAAIHYLQVQGMLPRSTVKRAALRLSRFRRSGLIAEVAFMLAHERQSTRDYEPDTDRLAAGGVPVIMAGGHESKHLEWYRAAQRLSERLGTEFAELPGAHGGFITHPGAFAGRLTEILTAPRRADPPANARAR